MTLPYVAVGEAGSATVVNRAIRQLLTDSGLDPDAAFPGFLVAGASGLGTGTNGLLALWDSGNLLKDGPANAAGFLSNDGAGVLVFKVVPSVSGPNDTAIILGRDQADTTYVSLVKFNASDEIEILETITLGGNVFKNAKLQDISETLQALGTVSGAQAIDYELGAYVKATLNANTQFTVTNWPASGVGALHFILDISGSITITWLAGTVNWGNLGAPVPTNAERLHVTLINDGTDIDGSWTDGY